MKVLVVYNSLTAQSVASAAMAMIKYPDCTLKDIRGVSTGDITTWIGTLSAVYGLILICYTVTTAGTGVISPAQQILLDAKCAQTVLTSGTSAGASADNTLTKTAAAWVVNAYAGMYVKTTGGTGLNQVRQIVSNSATILTLDSAWTVAIDGTTTFEVCETRDEFSWYLYQTSGNNKQAWYAWNHEKLNEGVNLPKYIWDMAGDKTTGSTAVNTINANKELYITYGAKYFLRDLTDATTIKIWGIMLTPPVNVIEHSNFEMYYSALYEFGKRMYVSAAAFSVTL